MFSSIFILILMALTVVEMKLCRSEIKLFIWEPLLCDRRTEHLVIVFEIELNTCTVIMWNCIWIWDRSIILNQYIIVSNHMLFVKFLCCIEINGRLMHMTKINTFKTLNSFTPVLHFHLSLHYGSIVLSLRVSIDSVQKTTRQYYAVSCGCSSSHFLYFV